MGSSASSNESSGSDTEEDTETFTTGGEEENTNYLTVPEKGQEEELNFEEFHLVDLFNSQSLREAVSKVSDIIPETVVQQHHGHLLRWLEERNMRNEETVTVSQFCDVLFNRGVNRKEAEEAFEQFDVDGEGVAYIDSMMEALKSTNGANLRGELSHAIRTLRACSLAPGVIDIFCPQTPELGNHGHRILKYLLRNRAPSGTLPYPALDGFTNITAMRMVVLEQYLKNAQNRKEKTSSDDSLNEMKFMNKPYCSLMASSNRQDVSRLADGDSSTFWQSDGPAHSHWIRMKLKTGVCLNSLSIVVTRSDQSYMPQHIVVTAGNSPGTMEIVKDIHIQSSYPSDEVVLLVNAKVKSRFVQINIKKCQYEGCDVRIHGLKAVGTRAMTGMEVNVTETSAIWYLSILSATATAAIPMAPHLQGAILENTKTALEQMPPLSLCKLYFKKNSFVTPKILDQVEEFLQTVAKDSDGKVSLEGLVLLLQLSLARGNIPAIIKCLTDIYQFFSDDKSGDRDLLVPGGAKILKNIENVHASLLKKHATVLEPFEIECDGGIKDPKMPPSNVLTNNWNTEAYISNKPSMTMIFHNPNHAFQLTKIDIKVSKGGIGPKCGVVLVADEMYASSESEEITCDMGQLEIYDSWTEEDCQELRAHSEESYSADAWTRSELELVTAFTLMDNFDEIEIPLETFPIGSHLIIKFLRPRQESATRLGIVGIRCHGYWKEKSQLERVEIKKRLEGEGVELQIMLERVLLFLVTLCQNVERMHKKDSQPVGKFQSVDFNLENLRPEAICQLYFKMAHNLSIFLRPREYLLQLFHSNIQPFTKAMEKQELARIEEKGATQASNKSRGSEEDAKPADPGSQPSEGKQTMMKKMFDHLCKLLESDLGPWNLASRVQMAASKVILDGAPIFFPDKEARKKQLFSMIYDPAEDQSSRTVFQSLCWYFGSVDSSGLLDLPKDISQTPVDTSAILSVFDTLLCVAYKEFEEVIDEDFPDPAKECSHVVNLLNSLQVGLLTWCHKILQDKSPEAESVVVDVLRDYCKSMFSWICNAITLWNQADVKKQCVNALKFSFVESTFHQLLTILNWMADTKIPHMMLANYLFKVAGELHKLTSHEAIKKELEFGTNLKESDDPVVLRTWQVESSHNYENNQNITQMFYCPGAQEFHVEFDSKCETERRYDYLEFTVTRGTKVRYDQKVGSDKWPETVTFKSVDRLQFLFHSDSTTNAWGYKFTVTAKGQADVSICWVQDMQLSLSSLLGKLCSQALHQKQDGDFRDKEADEENSLDAADVLKQVDRWSDLLVGGLRKATTEEQSSVSTDVKMKGSHPVHEFLEQLIGEREMGQQARELWERCIKGSTDPTQLGTGVGGDDIEKAVRTVFAALVWHSPTLTAHIQEYVGKDGTIPVNNDILAAFKLAESTRVYLVSLHQMQIKLQEAMDNQAEAASTQPEMVGKLAQHWCVQACLKKARFLLELAPCWEHKTEQQGLTSSPQEEADSRSKQILEMIKSPLLSAESISKVLKFRKHHAQVKTEVYQLACRYLDVDQDIFKDSFIVFLKQLLSMKDAPRIHFMQGLVGCGVRLEGRYRQAFYDFVEKLVNALSSFSKRSASSDKDNAALSCIKGFILHLLSCQWTPQDYQFLQRINLPQLLIGLAKTPDTIDMTDEQNDISTEKQLEVYNKCQEWLKHCVDENNFKSWYDEIEQTQSMEERRAMHMFVARFYERLDVNIQCDGCHSAIIGTRYRCLVCEDIDFCCTCFPGGVKVDRHTDEHPLVHLRFKCDGCQALIVGTRMHCNMCDDFDLCYGCHQTKNYPSRHKDHHVVTPIPMTVANQCKSQPQAYNQLHSWLLFSSFTLSMAKAAHEETNSDPECSAESLLENCVDLILTNLQKISKYENLSPGLGTSQEKVFTEKTLEKLLGLLAALIPRGEERDVTKMLKLEQLLPLLFKFARETTGQYVPTQHLAVGLIGKLIYREMPKFADSCLSKIEEKKVEDEAKVGVTAGPEKTGGTGIDEAMIGDSKDQEKTVDTDLDEAKIGEPTGQEKTGNTGDDNEAKMGDNTDHKKTGDTADEAKMGGNTGQEKTEDTDLDAAKIGEPTGQEKTGSTGDVVEAKTDTTGNKKTGDTAGHEAMMGDNTGQEKAEDSDLDKANIGDNRDEEKTMDTAADEARIEDTTDQEKTGDTDDDVAKMGDSREKEKTRNIEERSKMGDTADQERTEDTDGDGVGDTKDQEKTGDTDVGKKEPEKDEDGTQTVTFICSFGASCLEKCHLEWAALLPHLLMQLSQKPEWRAPIAKVLNNSFSELPDNCRLPTIFTLFTVAGFPEVFGHGSQAVYHDVNQENNRVMVLKHFLQNGQVYIVDSRTRKTKHVTEGQLDLKGIDSQPLSSEHLVTFLNISTQIMTKLKEGSDTLSVETIWALYLVLKTLHANFKPHFFEHIEHEFLPLLSFLANSQTGLSRHWLLKDLEVLSIQLYTSNRNDYNVQPLLGVGADFQVHNHKRPRKTLEEALECANADIEGSSSESGSASDDDAASNDTFIDDQLEFVTPKDSSQTGRLSVFSEDSEDSFYSFDQNDVNKSVTFNSNKAISPKPVNVVYSDPLSSLDEQAKTAIEATHEAFNAPLSVLRALYELSGSDVESFVQRASSSFQGDLLNVSEDVLTMAKRWEQPTANIIQNVNKAYPAPDKEESGPELTRRIAVSEPTQLIGSLISHSKQEMKERFRKHQKQKSKDLLIKELEKHGKVGTRDFLYKINHVLSIMYARNLLVSLLADWPEDGHMAISETLGCLETSQLLNILDLLQRTAEEDTYKKIISVVVKHCSAEILNQLCQSACCFMEEMALQPKMVESKHNYDNDTRIEGSVYLPGARYLLIKFDERCSTEDCCDILTIASDNKYKHNVRTFSGSSTNWINFDIPGDTLYYKFVSDFNNNDWGFKFTVIGNHVGRFETGFVLLDSVLQCSQLIGSISLSKLWASLIEVCNKQVGHPRLKSVRLLLRILQHISSEDKPFDQCHDASAESALGIDLTLLKPLWLLLNQMNTELSEDTTTCQSIHASHSALTELFFYVENLVQSNGLVDSYILALVDEQELAASIRQGMCNVAAIGKAIGVPNKASVLLGKDGHHSQTTPQSTFR